MTAASRPGGARKQGSRVARRARGAAVRGGQRRRQAQQSVGACSCHPCRTGGTSFVRGRGRRWRRRPVAPTTRRRGAGAPGGALRPGRLQRGALGAPPGAREGGGGGRLGRGGACRRRATVPASGDGGGRGPARQTCARQRPAGRWGVRDPGPRGGRGTAGAVWCPTRRGPRGGSRWQEARGGEAAVGRPPAGGAAAQSRPTQAAQAAGAAWGLGALLAGASGRAGPGALTCGAGRRGRRERGSPCGCGDERPRPRRGAARCASSGGVGWPRRHLRGHVPAFSGRGLSS